MNPVDLQDPRIQQLIAALKGQKSSGGPVFGGGSRTATAGPGRARADFFRPGQVGINYNPLQAQMAMGAPGILGLNSGHDTNAPAGLPGSQGDPAGGVTGQAPVPAPSIGDAIGPTAPAPPGLNNPSGSPYGGYSNTGTGIADPNDPNFNPSNPYARRQGMFNGAY